MDNLIFQLDFQNVFSKKRQVQFEVHIIAQSFNVARSYPYWFYLKSTKETP